jgi:hypothetical protein
VALPDFTKHMKGHAMLVLIEITEPNKPYDHSTVREAWKGLILPAEPENENELRGVVAYTVRGADMVAALRGAGKDDAADYWEKSFLPPFFRIFANRCKIVPVH